MSINEIITYMTFFVLVNCFARKIGEASFWRPSFCWFQAKIFRFNTTIEQINRRLFSRSDYCLDLFLGYTSLVNSPLNCNWLSSILMSCSQSKAGFPHFWWVGTIWKYILRLSYLYLLSGSHWQSSGSCQASHQVVIG